MNPVASTIRGHRLVSGYRLLQVDAEGELHVREIAKVIKPRGHGYVGIWFMDGPFPHDPAQAPHAEVYCDSEVVVFGD